MIPQMLIEKLNKYNYRFQAENNKLYINLGFSQEVTVDFSDSAKVLITDKLRGWNPLTGLIEMSLKTSMIYHAIGYVIALCFILTMSVNFCCEVTHSMSMLFLPLLLITATAWTTLWTLYFHIKAENMKRQIIDWLGNND